MRRADNEWTLIPVKRGELEARGQVDMAVTESGEVGDWVLPDRGQVCKLGSHRLAGWRVGRLAGWQVGRLAGVLFYCFWLLMN